MAMTLNEVYKSIDMRKEVFLEDLFCILRQRSISAQDDGVEECANLLADAMGKVGIKTHIFPTNRHPVVYGEIGPDDSPTMLVYGHYDVQPPEPFELWDSDPFEPMIKMGRIYARGSSDNKGQLFAHVKGVQVYKEAFGRLPIKVKFIFEGEEEISSPNLEPFVESHRDLLRSDICVFSDSHVHEDGHPIVVLGLKGMLYVQLTVREGKKDLHSMYAASVASPVWRLVHLLSTLKGEDGFVKFQGFYDDVRPPLPEEIEAVERIPYDESSVLSVLGVNSLLEGRYGGHHYKNLMFEPTCNIAGISAGYLGEGSKTVLPCVAKVKIDMRLVPDQKPQKIMEHLKNHMARCGYGDVEIKEFGSLEPSRTSIKHPFVGVIKEAVEDAWKEEAYVYPSIGGAGPNYVFEKHLKVPCITVPFAPPDQNNHAPNENITVAGYINGIKTSVAIINHLGEYLNIVDRP